MHTFKYCFKYDLTFRHESVSNINYSYHKDTSMPRLWLNKPLINEVTREISLLIQLFIRLSWVRVQQLYSTYNKY